VERYVKTSSGPMQLVVQSDAMGSVNFLSSGETHTKVREGWNLGSVESGAKVVRFF